MRRVVVLLGVLALVCLPVAMIHAASEPGKEDKAAAKPVKARHHHHDSKAKDKDKPKADAPQEKKAAEEKKTCRRGEADSSSRQARRENGETRRQTCQEAGGRSVDPQGRVSRGRWGAGFVWRIAAFAEQSDSANGRGRRRQRRGCGLA